MSSEIRNCQNCKKDFAVESEDFDFYKKMDVPPPTWCPNCRMMRRMAFWNQNSFFKKRDALTGKEIFSNYHEDSDVPIYERDFWFSDQWDQMQWGREYDFSRPFFEQLSDLKKVMPRPSRSVQRMINSDYCNQAGSLRDCYMCFNADNLEDCQYGVSAYNVKKSVDFYQVNNCEFSYELFNTGPAYQNFYVSDGSNCRNCWFMFKCVDCSDCFGCVNLRHKQYCFFNEQLTKEEYEKRIKALETGSYKEIEAIKKKFQEFKLTFPVRYTHSLLNENVIGDYVYRAKNAQYCFQAIEIENVRYSQNMARGVRDSHDYTSWGNNAELCYETAVCGENARMVKFSVECWPGAQDLEYCIDCHTNTSNCFGCIGLKNKQYCILNKQYTKEEYEALIPKIKKHMDVMPYVDKQGRVYKYGEFFPVDLSPLAYNEAAVIDYSSLTKEQAKEWGFFWREAKVREYQITMPAADLPDHISDATDRILKEIISCMACARAYRFTASELLFYRHFNLPLPRKCFDCRRSDRVKMQNFPRWYKRACQCNGMKDERGVYDNVSVSHATHKSNERCPVTFETTYAPDRPEIVYCESCYQQEVV